jgi:pre-mRNA-splicing factor SYF1
VYERGIDLYNYPVAFEIWNIYLSKFVSRYVSFRPPSYPIRASLKRCRFSHNQGGSKLERARDLFEQALEKCPEKFCKPLFLMYAQLEEEHGLAKRAMGIYDRAATAVQDTDKMEVGLPARTSHTDPPADTDCARALQMFTIYIAKAAANFGLPATRSIYQRAIEVLPDRQTADMCLRFAALERKLGEIDRARAIYAHASQFCDPRTYTDFWSEWNAFESESPRPAFWSDFDD